MYSEEVDLCYRLTAAGWQVHFAPVARVVHVGGASTMQHRAAMNIELFASIMQFYQRHYSAIRVAQLALILKFVMLVRLIRDTLHLCVTSDTGKRAIIAEDIETWRHVLLGHWPKHVTVPNRASTRIPSPGEN
jgi:GT2 family glycosyltransferase